MWHNRSLAKLNYKISVKQIPFSYKEQLWLTSIGRHKNKKRSNINNKIQRKISLNFLTNCTQVISPRTRGWSNISQDLMRLIWSWAQICSEYLETTSNIFLLVNTRFVWSNEIILIQGNSQGLQSSRHSISKKEKEKKKDVIKLFKII